MNSNLLTLDMPNARIERSKVIPEWVSEVEAESCYLGSGGNVNYLLVDNQYNISKDKVVNFNRIIQKPNNIKGVEECSQIIIDLNPRNMELVIHCISVFRNQLQLDKIESIDIQVLRREYQAERNILSGDISVSIILSDLKVNDILEISYSLVDYDEIKISKFSRYIQLEYAVPIRKLHQSVMSIDKLHYKFIGQEYTIVETQIGSKTKYEILLENVLSKEIINNIPWKNSYSLLHIGVSFSWREISDYYNNCFKFYKIDPVKIKQLEKNLISKNLSDEEIILCILDFMNTNIRYFYNHKVTDYIKPGDPNLTMERGYGDCKDFVCVFQSLLTNFKIESYPVLVNTQYGKMLDEFIPAVNVFDHVIIKIQLDGLTYFIDPTIRQSVSKLENLYLPDYGFSLSCDGKSENLICFKDTLACKDSISTLDVYHCHSWEKNDYTFDSKVTLSGLQAIKFKNLCDNGHENKIFELIGSHYSRFFNIEKIIERRIFNKTNIDNKIGYVYRCKISFKKFIKNKRNYQIEVIPMDILDHIYSQLPKESNVDLYFGSPLMIEYYIDIVDENINFIGNNEIIIEDEAFLLSKSVLGVFGKFEFKYKFKKKKDVIQLARYDEFVLHYNQALDILIGNVTKTSSRYYDLIAKFNISEIIFILIYLIVIGTIFLRYLQR